MVEEAIRNGTWVPPAPPVRAARVDLSKKPELWEAYLGDGGWQLGSLGHGSGKELEKFDYSRDWESIKPISASYAAPLTSVPCSGSPPNFSSISPPVPIPARRDDEENQRTPEVSTGTTTSLLSRARLFLHHHPTPIFPTSTSSSADNGTQAHSNSTNISLTELSSNSPPTVRVAVLIAMPSLSSHGSSTTTASLSSSLSPKAQPTTSHHPQSSPSSTLKFSDDEEFPLPHLEMGIAEVTIGRSENSSSWDSTHAKGEVKTYSRGSSYAEPWYWEGKTLKEKKLDFGLECVSFLGLFSIFFSFFLYFMVGVFAWRLSRPKL